MFPRRLLSLLAVCIIVVAGAACGDDDAGGTAATSTGAPADATATVEASDIRTLDLESVKDVQDLLTETGGQLVQAEVLYADLTGDGVDEAVAPASSGGTLGDVGYIVLTPRGAGTATLLRSSADGGVAVDIVDGKLVETRPAPGPDDPECCPTMLRKTTYAWDGDSLEEESSGTVANPDAAGFKPTPADY